MTEAKKGGRPRKIPAAGERYAVTARLPTELRARFEKAADEAGRSLSQEAEFRLTRSFAEREALQELLGGESTASVLALVAEAVSLIERQTGCAWRSDHWTGVAVRAAAARIMAAASPPEPDGSQEMFLRARAVADARHAVEALRARLATLGHATEDGAGEALRSRLVVARKNLERAEREPQDAESRFEHAWAAGHAAAEPLAMTLERRRADEVLTREEQLPDGKYA